MTEKKRRKQEPLGTPSAEDEARSFSTGDDLTPPADEQSTASHESEETRSFFLNPHLRVIRCSKDEFLVKHGSRSLYSQMIVDERRTGMLGRVLEHATQPTSVVNLTQSGVLSIEEQEQAKEVVAYLSSRGVLIDPAENFAGAYLRTVLSPDSGKNGSSATQGPQLAAATVAVIGAGPVGSMVARGLAASGIGNLIVIDQRTVSAFPYLDRFLDLPPGTLRPDAPMAEAVGAYLSNVGALETSHRVADPTDEAVVKECFVGADLVIVAWEAMSPTLFHVINQAALEAGKPWMTVFFDGSEAIVGPTYLPGASGCYYEFEVQNEATLLLRDEFVLFKDHAEDTATRSVYYVLPSYAQIAAGFATTSVLHMLMLGQTFTSGRAIRLDLERMSIDFVDVMRLPRCPACRPERPAFRHLFL